MTLRIILAITLSAALAQTVATQSQTPAQCVADVRAHVTKRTQELRPLTSASAATLTTERTTMMKACVAKFDLQTIAEKDLAGLADLYSEAGETALANAAIARALASNTLTDTDRAPLLVQSIRMMLGEPKGDARNARIEKVVDQLDAMPAAALAHQISAHSSMNGFYRGDDIDAGIIKHSTWLINTGKTLSPEMRKKYGATIISAYVNMAEAWAGQGKTTEAIALLKRGPVEWADLPNVSSRIDSTLERYLLVGTAGAAVTAPTWLNMPAGTTAVDMKGHVTLLEFTAHWCGPCKESYPGINRIRTKYEARGFRVVLATQLYGYFQAEQNLDADTEIARDRAYFAEHHLNVPVAITAPITTTMKDGVAVRTRQPDPNDAAYKVGGIPQIQIIDKQGRIRLIMVGYDDANEAGLAAFIEKLLAEK